MWDLSFAALQEGKQPIALCEAGMVPLVMLQWPEAFRGHGVVWYVDNTAAMAAFVKGASANQFLERIVGLCRMLAHHLDARIWFEWVDSDSNWSDGVGRLFENDELAQRLGFHLQAMPQPAAEWAGSWMDLWLYSQAATEERALV